MPRSFLIRKQEESNQTRSKLRGMFGITNGFESKQLTWQDPTVSTILTAVSALEEKPISMHNDSFIFSKNDLTIKKQLYNEFFVLDDPKVWQKYVERQHEEPKRLQLSQDRNNNENDLLRKIHSSDNIQSFAPKTGKSRARKDQSRSRAQIAVKPSQIDGFPNASSDGEQDKVPSAGSNGELSPKSNEDQEKVYQCKYCSKSFTRSWNFQRHVLIHTGRKPHKCDKCPKAFVLAAHLKIHNRIHTGEKPYKCNICGRGFAQLTNLQRHVLTHTGEKPHKCSYCGKGFVSSSDLRRHVRIHTGEKPYQCKVCSKAFTTSGNLQSHVLTHTGEKPYQCTTCNWKFISSSNLRTHIRTHHYGNNNSEKDEASLKQEDDCNADATMMSPNE